MLRGLVAVVVVALLLVSWPSRAAGAERAPRGEDTSAPGTTSAYAAFSSFDLGVRSFVLDGATLRGNRPGSKLVVRGEDVGPRVALAPELRFGLRAHGVLLGFGAAIGFTDGIPGRLQPVGDLVVRPSGLVIAGLASASVGYRRAWGPFAGRLEAFVGAEIVGIGLERPGFPETKISYANTTRAVLAPRLTFERAFTDVSLGVFVQPELTTPGNVVVGISITPWFGLGSAR